ncbi:hypothetical protein ACB098_01G076100 [Castanea mollissima]
MIIASGTLVLETVYGGVPIVAWPLYAERKMNSMVLMVEMMVALALRESEQKLVSATKLEKRVRELTDPSRERSEKEGFNHHR